MLGLMRVGGRTPVMVLEGDSVDAKGSACLPPGTAHHLAVQLTFVPVALDHADDNEAAEQKGDRAELGVTKEQPR